MAAQHRREAAVLAPAKVNLTLAVLGRRADGYHDLVSLVAFADIGDRLAFAPGPDLALAVDGPMAARSGPASDNLVLKAARALAARRPDLPLGRFCLHKALPVAAGLGGGSSDAAAALRLLAAQNGIAPDDPVLHEAARATGADVPVCLAAAARLMAGAGEQISAPIALPPLAAVLVNPGLRCPTGPVFGALGLAPGERRAGAGHPLLPARLDLAALLPMLRTARNDLEAPARTLVPAIGEVLDVLAAVPGCRLARMSGSGATCFALFDGNAAAASAAAAIAARQPGWWVRATTLR